MSGTIFVTGATGLVGANIVKQLVERGRNVRALVREQSLEKAQGLLPPECELVPGDVIDPGSLVEALEDGECELVYHAAGLPEQWFPNPGIFQKVNVQGTRNVLTAARDAGVRRVVYTSTIDVFAGRAHETYDESVIDPEQKNTFYERSKQDADRVAVEYLEEGMDIVFLHPSGVYGPGPVGSPGPNGLVADLIRGKVPMLLPGGFPIVYSEDCARGHILAAERGAAGDRFILSESYHTLREFAELVDRVHGVPKIPRIMPQWFAIIFAAMGEVLSGFSGRPPLLPRGQLEFLLWQAIPKNDRARAVLDWEPIPAEEGVRRTIEHLRTTGAL